MRAVPRLLTFTPEEKPTGRFDLQHLGFVLERDRPGAGLPLEPAALGGKARVRVMHVFRADDPLRVVGGPRGTANTCSRVAAIYTSFSAIATVYQSTLCENGFRSRIRSRLQGFSTILMAPSCFFWNIS